MASLLPIYSLRIPEQLMLRVKNIAMENKRSVNKEIEYALEKYVIDCENKADPYQNTKT